MKAMVNLPKTKLTPSCSYELFTRFIKEDGVRSNKMRFGAGLSLPIKKHSEFHLGYKLEYLNRAKKSDLFTSIMIIGYTLKLNSRKY